MFTDKKLVDIRGTSVNMMIAALAVSTEYSWENRNHRFNWVQCFTAKERRLAKTVRSNKNMEIVHKNNWVGKRGRNPQPKSTSLIEWTN